MKTQLPLEEFGWRVFIVGSVFGLICGFLLGVTFVYTFILK